MTYFRASTAFATAMAENRPCIALVTGGKSGIGRALTIKIASFPFVDQVLAVSRSITDEDVSKFGSPKMRALAADVGSEEGRRKIVAHVDRLCSGSGNQEKQLRYLIHNAGTIDPLNPRWRSSRTSSGAQ